MTPVTAFLSGLGMVTAVVALAFLCAVLGHGVAALYSRWKRRREAKPAEPNNRRLLVHVSMHDNLALIDIRRGPRDNGDSWHRNIISTRDALKQTLINSVEKEL